MQSSWFVALVAESLAEFATFSNALTELTCKCLLGMPYTMLPQGSFDLEHLMLTTQLKTYLSFIKVVTIGLGLHHTA